MIKVAGLQENLGDGLVICSCLPLTVNMVLVLTASAGGDEAAAVFNAALGNLLGVVISPMLILLYVGVKGTIDLAKLFTKLVLIILLPILVGQAIVKLFKPAAAFAARHKRTFKSVQEYALVYTVYTVFCKTFLKGSPSTPVNIIIMIAVELFLISFVMLLSWYCLRLLYKRHPELRIMGLFGCTHKSIAVGIPLISTIYETSPYLGLYTLPLLIWHPTQLIMGTALVPALRRFHEREKNSVTNDPVETDTEVI
jgi:sodium/bile acid cotransporter 7